MKQDQLFLLWSVSQEEGLQYCNTQKDRLGGSFVTPHAGTPHAILFAGAST
jgi:hypothetical protein